MRVLRSVLVLLAAFALSMSFAIPVEDLPDTSYDESEAAPYERTPPFSVMQQEFELAPGSEFPSSSSGKLNTKYALSRRSAKTHPVCDSVTILDHSLRC